MIVQKVKYKYNSQNLSKKKKMYNSQRYKISYKKNQMSCSMFG